MSLTTERRLTVLSIVIIVLGFVALVYHLRNDQAQILWLRLSEVCYLIGMLGLMFAHPRVHDRSVVLAKWLAILSLVLAQVIVRVMF
jgi:hypothetical protein